jgi:hypothetical protein
MFDETNGIQDRKANNINFIRADYPKNTSTGRQICPYTPHRSYRTLRDGLAGARCPRHFVPAYDRAVPPGQSPVALTPPCAHGAVPISDQTASYLRDGGLFEHAFQEFVSGYDR